MSHLILIVDDHLDCATPLKALLRRAGYAAECVESAAEALRFLEGGRRPSLIVLDNMMPTTSGLDLLRLLRADPATADTPVVMYSASDGPEEVERARRLGAADFVCKGRVDYPDLLFRIGCLIAGRVPVAEVRPAPATGTGVA